EIALLDRFLQDNSEQDIRITTQIQLPRALLNIVKHGQLIQIKLTHTVGTSSDYSAFTNARVITKTFAPPSNKTQEWYDVDLELAMLKGTPSGAFDVQNVGESYSGIPTLPRPT